MPEKWTKTKRNEVSWGWPPTLIGQKGGKGTEKKEAIEMAQTLWRTPALEKGKETLAHREAKKQKNAPVWWVHINWKVALVSQSDNVFSIVEKKCFKIHGRIINILKFRTVWGKFWSHLTFWILPKFWNHPKLQLPIVKFLWKHPRVRSFAVVSNGKSGEYEFWNEMALKKLN